MITFSDSGRLIDHFLWTYLIDDAEQIYDDVAVSGNVFVTGYSPMYGAEIEKIYSKTIINEGGKFLPTYKAGKEPYDIEDGI